MKTLADYIFSDGWASREMDIAPGKDYLVQADVGDLKRGDHVRFVGFDDVDNHYGIFVFTDARDRILEVSGDFSGPNHTSFVKLKKALSKA